MNSVTSSPLPSIDSGALRPYVSTIILVYTGPATTQPVAALRKHLIELKTKPRSNRSVDVVASGLTNISQLLEHHSNQNSEVAIDSFITRTQRAPSWLEGGSISFTDTTHEICVWLTLGDLLAVHTDSATGVAIQRWLDRTPRPPFRRLEAGLFQETLLSGEAKALWLRGAHPRRSTKADSKNLNGQRLQDALNPLDDNSFAMGSAKAEIETDPRFAKLTGIVGTTPRKSKVWLRPAESMADFVDVTFDLLRTLALAIHEGRSDDEPYPWLANEVRSLSGVFGAFDIAFEHADSTPTSTWTPELQTASETLERSTLVVTANTHGAGFTVSVGLDGHVGGELRCAVSHDGTAANLAFGYEGSPTDPSQTAVVLDALHQHDLLTIYYESGHAISQGGIFTTSIGNAVFPKWQWEDFTDTNICQEKPLARTPQDIHDMIGSPLDRSLFSWVVRKFGPSGWLTCDDGSNEIADFVLYGFDGITSLIHVKGANSASTSRRVSVVPYEVVASQASKNLVHVDARHLLSSLSRPSVATPAVWYGGSRQPDRSEMLEYLAAKSLSTPTNVIIVQPHVRRTALVNARSSALLREQLRARLLETLLNTTRGSATGVGSDLVVIGSA